jgi:phage gpG-like protein
MPTVTISITGTKEEKARLRRISKGLLNMTDAMKAVGSNFLAYYSTEPFYTQGGVFGKQWPALKPATITQKVKYNPTTATYPLIRSGLMMRSFKASTGQTFMQLDNTQEYFKYHQLGTPKLPQRMMLTLTQSRYDAIKSIIESDIRSKIQAAS